MYHTKIAIIGAGASGLMAAYKAAAIMKSQGEKVSVTVLEGNPKAGKKLLATGNGRCNLTNKNISPENYHGDKLVKEINSLISAEKVIDEFAKLGVLCRADECGRVYPANLQATAVLKALRLYSEENDVNFIYDFTSTEIKKQVNGYLIKSSDGQTVFAEKCILACGGKASPAHSCIINGYDLAQSLGHTKTKILPALSPVICKEKYISSLKGMRCKAKVNLRCEGKDLFGESGEIIFGDKWLSGICVFNLSIILADFIRCKSGKSVKLNDFTISLDLSEDYTSEQIEKYLNDICKAFPNRSIGDLLIGFLNIKIGEVLLKSLGFNLSKQVSNLNKTDIVLIAKTLKNWMFTVECLPDFSKAQVTAGGIPLDEINTNTCESNKALGLYMCGELLDVHGDCGGYNLHFAWATGMLAGESAAKNN